MEENKRLLTESEKNYYAENNMKLAHYVAHMFSNYPIEHDELFSIALVGLTNALNTYLVGSAAKFSTYALTCMKNEILYALRKETKHINNTISDETVIYSDSSGNDFKLSDTISENMADESSVEDNLLMSEDYDFIRASLDTLSDFEKEVITRRYGIDRDPETQARIAATFSMSQANISKIEQSILKKLYIRMKGRIELEDNSYYKDE